MRHLLLCIPVLVACTLDEPGRTGDDTTALHTSGSFSGRYEVPTHGELVPAARYPVDDIDWAVVGDTATLEYDLPVGLVGGDVEVTLSGTIDRATQTATLTSHIGSATCTVAGSIVTCHEAFMNLGTLPISVGVVERRAAVEYSGPVSHRLAVARQFASEPLGTAVFDLQVPSLDDRDEPPKNDDED